MGSTTSDILKVADKCFDDQQYQSALILYTKLNSKGKIALSNLYLKQFPLAVEFAKQANNLKVWKQVCIVCANEGEFKLAQIAGMNVIIHPDHLDEIVKEYTKLNAIDEIIQLLETCLSAERSHIGIFTELGILYAKYKSQKLMDYIKNYSAKTNIPKLLRVCETMYLQNEIVHLYLNYEEYDNAIKVMMQHSPIAFNHDLFVNTLLRVKNNDIYYKAIEFYIDEEPEGLNDMLR